MPTKEKPLLEINTSRQFTSWMVEQRSSLAFTTYQTGKLFFVGLSKEGKLAIAERTFERCMGLTTDTTQTLWMAGLHQFRKFTNTLPAGTQTQAGNDAVYVPRLAYTTGDVDIHDIAVGEGGQPYFVNSLFSCIATPSDIHSFKVVWKPPFISKLAAEDRCHLNGLALQDGKPKYVTAVAETDVHEGWRQHRKDGGLLIDVTTDKIVAKGLSMPHSPRIYHDEVYLINSGTGEFGKVDVSSGSFEPIAFCPGYARGLAFIGDFAVIGLSQCRDNKTFQDLPFNQTLRDKNIEARCGLQVVDLRSGDVVHSLTCEGVVKELYDVVLLPGVRQPTALGFKSDEIRRTISVDAQVMTDD